MIRNMKKEDIGQVLDIWLAGNIEAHSFIPEEYWRGKAPEVREQLLLAEIYVYETDGTIQAFAGMQEDYLAGIFVTGSARCAGIGKKLLDHIKERHPAFSLNVYQANRRAVAFYRREGLKIVSEETDPDTGSTEYTMRWRSAVPGQTLNRRLAKINECPHLLHPAAQWFHSKWDIPADAYLESMEQSISPGCAVPQWYLILDERDEILAGAGIIENDFHDRKDLTPNLCALYVEEEFRGCGLARELLAFIRNDMALQNIPRIYLVTDHTELYETYGWTFLTMVQDESGCPERMYTVSTADRCHRQIT